MNNIMQQFKPIIKSDVSIYVEAFGDDDYDTRYAKTLIINKVKQDKDSLRREDYNNYRDYENMLREKYEHYKNSLAIVGAIGDEGGGTPYWFKKAVRYGGELVKYNGEIVTYSG